MATNRHFTKQTHGDNFQSAFDQAIVSGGDERIEIKSNGLNKYLVNANQRGRIFNRGSCTCSTLGEEVRPSVEALFRQYLDNPDLDTIRERQRARMKAPLLESGVADFDICFAPSGSDLCFYPLLFAQLLQPGKPIMNLISCPEELGTGSVLANRGLYFSEKSQLQPVVKNTPLSSHLSIDYRTFPSRTADGLIIDHKSTIYEAIEAFKGTHNILVNLVIGSKSGIENNLNIVEDGPRDVCYVVDLCQMRAVPKLLNHLIELNCLVMITGSKFYQSPPFCGAMLVPKHYAEPIAKLHVNKASVAGFDTVYSKFDFPPAFASLRQHFSEYENIGLSLRWEAAICESENLTEYTEREVTFAILLWNKHVVDYLKSKPCFSLMRDQDKTNRSIISFMVRGKSDLFTSDQLKQVYEHLLLNGHKLQNRFDKLTIGQPVEYGSHAFIRLALGSSNVRQLIDSDIDLSDDFALIDAIETIATRIDQ